MSGDHNMHCSANTGGNEQLIDAAQQALEALYMAYTRQWPENKIGAAINALSTAIEQAQRQQALDKKAENARELGIQMQPEPVTCAKQLSKELLGVITDVEEGEGFDNLCLDTIKYVYEQLATLPAAPVQEPDLLGLKPDTQEAIKGWIADGTFVERAIGVLHEQESENMRLEKLVAAQRQWVGLTDEEIEKMRHLIDWTAHWSYGTFARAIEQKLRERNGGAA